MPRVLVYKAKAKYARLVPVELSDDRKSVISYPDPKDIQTGSSAPAGLPVSLHKGYWLDRRGVSTHTAFINMTYEAYARLKAPLPAEELFKRVVDTHPVIELCDCGPRRDGASDIKMLNRLIDAGRLRKDCKVLK